MADKLSLEILIKTIADAQGIKATDAEIKTLTKDIESTTKAGDELNLTSTDISRRLEGIRSTASQALPPLNGVGEAAKKVANGTASLTQQVGRLKTAADGANQVMNGLSQGGIGGLVQVGRGAITTLTALATTTLGAVLIPVLGTAAAGFLYLSNKIKENEDQLKKWADESDRSSARRAASLEEMRKASDTSLKAQLADLAKLASGYDRLTAAIDKSRQATATKNEAETGRKLAEIDAREAEALEQAATPEARAGVQKKFAGDRELVRSQAQDIEIENKKSGAAVDRIGAEEVIAKAQAIIDQATADAANAAQAAADARAAARDFRDKGGDLRQGYGAELLDDARVTSKNSQEQDARLQQVSTQQRAVIEGAEARLEEAKLAEELAEVAKQTLEAQRRKAAAEKRSADAAEKEARIREQIAQGISESTARNREKANQGGTVVTPNGAYLVDPGVQQTPAAKAGAEAIQKSQAPQALDLQPVADAISSAETPAPLDTVPLQQSFAGYHQTNVAKHQQSAAALAAQAKQIADLGRALAAVQIAARNASEAA